MSSVVVVVGSLHLDVMVWSPARPQLGETMVGQRWAMRPGGKGGNQAVAAARHGASVAMVGLVGDDVFGARLRDNLAARGVANDAVAVRAGAASGMSVALVEPAGDYGAVIVSGVNLALDEAAVLLAREAVAKAACLLLQNEIPDSANETAARLARRAGGTVVLNAAPARALPRSLLALVDILVVNALEAEALCGVAVAGLAAAAQAAELLTERAPCAIVTAGGHGVVVARRDAATLAIPPFPVTVISTHGAGDTFVGALAARLAVGDTLERAAGYANAAAALLVGATEAQAGTLGQDDVARLLAGRPA